MLQTFTSSGLRGRWGVKTLRGITTSPILGNDGSIRIADGYDEATGLWCHNIPQVNVPARPTENEASSALARLRAFFCTFPFKDADLIREQARGVDVVDLGKRPGLHESSLITAVMTSVCRQSLELAPGFLCDAPNYSGAGTGKGLLVRAVCMIGSGARPAAFTSGHDAGELDKRVTSAVIEARPAIFLDNFNAKDLVSDVLASVLTECPSEVRILGRTGMVKVYNRTLITVTGNAVQIAEDMARRWLNAHLDARMEDPERRPFPPGFLDRVYAARGDLLSAALTIWRWGRQNQCQPGIPIGSYEVWAQWCRDPLVALGARDPMERIAEIKAADPEAARARGHLRAMVGAAPRHSPQGERPAPGGHQVDRRQMHHQGRRAPVQPPERRRLGRRKRRHARRRIQPEPADSGRAAE